MTAYSNVCGNTLRGVRDVEMKRDYAFIVSESCYPLSNSAMLHITSVVANFFAVYIENLKIFYIFDILSFASPCKLTVRNSVIL
jgi:hypothetical protein